MSRTTARLKLSFRNCAGSKRRAEQGIFAYEITPVLLATGRAAAYKATIRSARRGTLIEEIERATSRAAQEWLQGRAEQLTETRGR